MIFTLIIDRILDGLAVCEQDDAFINIPLSQIEGEAKEGDVLRPFGTSPARYAIDADAALDRRRKMKERFEKLKDKSR